MQRKLRTRNVVRRDNTLKKCKNERKKYLANVIRERRLSLGISQGKLCDIVGLRLGRRVPVSTLSSYELAAKSPDYDMLCAFADVFGVSTDFMLGHRRDYSKRKRTP